MQILSRLSQKTHSKNCISRAFLIDVYQAYVNRNRLNKSLKFKKTQQIPEGTQGKAKEQN